MRTVAIVNQKGGCGKTTTAVNLGAVLAHRGVRTLLVDLDPQSHCAVALGVPEGRIARSVADALVDDLSEDDLAEIVWELGPSLHLLPSSTMLAALEAPGGGLHERADRDRRLARLLARLAPGHDVCLVDCPPTIGLLTFNALRAADEVLVPVETGYFALKGAEKQVETIDRVAARLDRPIDWSLLPTLHRPEIESSREILLALRRRFGDRVLGAVVREDAALRESAAIGQPVCTHHPDAPSRADYESVADAVLARVEASGGRESAALRARTDEAGAIEIEVKPNVPLPGAERTEAAADARPAGGDTPAPPAGHPGAGPRREPVPGTRRVGRAAELADRLRALAARVEPAGTGPPAEPADAGSATSAVPTGAVATDPTDSGTTAATATPTRPTPIDGVAAASIAAAVATATGRSSSPPRFGEAASAPEAGARSAPPLRMAEEPAPPVATEDQLRRVAGVLGATPTSRGVLFVQPSGAGGRIAVAGAFNGWSPTSHVLEHRPEVGVHQLLLTLPPGRHPYRLVVDGRWCEDPHNPERETTGHGDVLNLVVVDRPV